MSARRRKRKGPAPVKLVCRPGLFKTIKLCQWTCRRPGVVQFRNARRPALYAILHPSTKQPGYWQVSRFDDAGAISDTAAPTCDAALKNAEIGRAWRLEDFA